MRKRRQDLEHRRHAQDDPRGFLARLENAGGAILDEVQRVPDLFSYLQGFIDDRRGGPLVLTGSQHFLLSERISQSLAGRVALLELMPLSLAELTARTPLKPGELDVDVVIDLGSRRLPVEIKSGATVAASALAGLDFFCGVSGDDGGLLVYAGDESYARGNHRVRPWWACS